MQAGLDAVVRLRRSGPLPSLHDPYRGAAAHPGSVAQGHGRDEERDRALVAGGGRGVRVQVPDGETPGCFQP
jgi:hypothetical protein